MAKNTVRIYFFIILFVIFEGKINKNMENLQKKNATDGAGGGVSAQDRERAQAHYEAGKRLWAEGRQGAAMTEYNRAVALDPDSPAATALEMADSVMDFFDRSRYNP